MAKEPVTGSVAKSTSSNGETDLDKDKHPKITDGKELGGNEVNLNETRDVVQQRLDKLNSENEEGHAKNMEKIDHDHRHVEEDRKDAKDSDGGEDRIGGADPKLGREDNGNTPRIDKHGNKSWHPPGVAGAQRV